MSSRTSNILADSVEMEIQGLQYRRNSRKISLENLQPLVDSKMKKDSIAEEDTQKGSYAPYAPDGGYGWMIVLGSFLSNFVLDGISVTGGALQPFIQEASGKTLRSDYNLTGEVEHDEDNEDKYEYGISVAMYSLIGSILLSVTLLVGPLISILTNRFGFRAVGMAGSITASFGIFMSWACSPSIPNIWIMLFFYGVIGGLGFGMMFQPSVVIVGMWFDKRRALATGIAICGTGVGSIVFPLMTHYMGEWSGWQGALILQSAIALTSTGFAYFYRPLPIKFVKAGVRRTSVAIPIEGVVADSSWRAMINTLKEMGPLCKSPTFLILAIAGAVTMLGFYAPYAFIPDRAVKELGMDSDRAVFAVSTIGIANTVGRLFFGYISDHPKMNTLILNNVALTLGGIATMLSPFLTEEYQLYIYIIIFGFMIAIFAVLRSILILKFMGMDKFNNSFGLALLFMGVMTLIGNPIGGALKDYTRRYDYSFYVAGAYFVISGIMCYPLQRVSDWEKKNINNNPKGSEVGGVISDKEKDIEMF